MWCILILTLLIVTPVAQAADNKDWVMEQRFQTQLVAAKKGDKEAQLEIGTMYERGLGIDQNMAQAIKWLDKAAAQGEVTAKAELGIIYFQGRGTRPNYDKAFTLLRAAATQRIPNAQFYLARCYELGKGTSRNLDQALHWYREAAANGYYPAQAKVKTLKAQLAGASPTPAAVGAGSGSKNPVLKAILAGHWMLRKTPAAYLPSSLTRCAQQDQGDVSCTSGQQVRTIGPRVITYRTDAHLSGFEPTGKFNITYTDEIIKIGTVQKKSAGANGAPGTPKPPAATAPAIRQGPQHSLSCVFKDPKTIDCLKDDTFNVQLVDAGH